jgi:hypothetical protein
MIEKQMTRGLVKSGFGFPMQVGFVASGLKTTCVTVFALALIHLVMFSATFAQAPQGAGERPRQAADSAPRLIQVSARGDLQLAINSANCGDTIVLPAGATFQGKGDKGFLFSAKGCSNYITVTTSLAASLPSGRIDPGNATAMPRIVPPSFGGTTYPAITFTRNSSFWRFVGIEVTTLPGQPYANVLIDVGPYVSWKEAPSDLIFDRVYVHSLEDGTNNPEATSRIGFNVFARRLEVTNSRVSFPAAYVKGTKAVDNQYAFLTIAGPGPITIDNCFLSAWYNAFFTGGAALPTDNNATVAPGATLSQATLSNVKNLKLGDLVALLQKQCTVNAGGVCDGGYYGTVKIIGISGHTVAFTPYGRSDGGAGGSPLTAAPVSPGDAQWSGYLPSNITIRRSTFYVNPTIVQTIARETRNYPKGFFEIKAVDGLLMEGNDFTGYPAPLAFTARNQGTPAGAPSPWSTIKNVTFKNNRVLNISTAQTNRLWIIVLEDNYFSSTVGRNFVIENNLFATGSNIADVGSADGLIIRHNTFINRGGAHLLNSIDSAPTRNLQLKDNIVFNNEYGVHCQAGDYKCFPNLFDGNMTGNVIIGAAQSYRPTCGNPYPAGNSCVSVIDSVGFVDAARGNYRLALSSRYKGRASDGKDPGVDMDELLRALSAEDRLQRNSR